MAYIEIGPIEKNANKISKQLDILLEQKPNMYTKTRERYQKLAHSLLQSVEKISNILEEECLISHEHEFNEFEELSNSEIDVSDISDAIDSIQSQLQSYEQLACSDNVPLPERRCSNKDIISRFAQILFEGSNKAFECEEACKCATILHKWFRTRFTPVVKNPKFRYQISQIPEWIYYIVILFGKYQSDNNIQDFLTMFNNWCEDVENNPSNCWAVPYQVYELSKSIQPESFTLNAVVLFDILMEDLYYLLTESSFSDSKVFLDGSAVANIVRMNNPALLPKIRTRLSNHRKLIDECNLTYLF